MDDRYFYHSLLHCELRYFSATSLKTTRRLLGNSSVFSGSCFLLGQCAAVTGYYEGGEGGAAAVGAPDEHEFTPGGHSVVFGALLFQRRGVLAAQSCCDNTRQQRIAARHAEAEAEITNTAPLDTAPGLTDTAASAAGRPDRRCVVAAVVSSANGVLSCRGGYGASSWECYESGAVAYLQQKRTGHLITDPA